MIPVRFCTVLALHSCAGIKTRFKALLKTQYLTLGPNFLFFIVLPPTCYFYFVNPWFRCGSAPFFLYIPVPVSKHDLKHFSKSDIFGFTGGAFMDLNCVFNDSEMLFNDFEMFCLWFWKAELQTKFERNLPVGTFQHSIGCFKDVLKLCWEYVKDVLGII